MPTHLPPFDPSRDFVAIRYFRYDGVIFARKADFPKDGVPLFKLRRLYETRHIGYKGDEGELVRTYPPRRPEQPEPVVEPESEESPAGSPEGQIGEIELSEETPPTEFEDVDAGQSGGDQLEPGDDRPEGLVDAQVEAATETSDNDQLLAANEGDGEESEQEIEGGASGAEEPIPSGSESGEGQAPDDEGNAAAPDQAAPTTTDEDTEEASGTAREAPGASGSPEAQSGEASASTQTGEAGNGGQADPASSTNAEETGAQSDQTDKPQLDHDHDGQAGGSEPDNEGDRDTLIKRLVKRHDHAELFAKASGLKGVTKRMTKAEIAAALVDAGRVGNDGPA